MLNGTEQRSEVDVKRAMNQIHGFTVNYSKFTLAKMKERWKMWRKCVCVFTMSSDTCTCKTYKIGLSLHTSQVSSVCLSLGTGDGMSVHRRRPPTLSFIHPVGGEMHCENNLFLQSFLNVYFSFFVSYRVSYCRKLNSCLLIFSRVLFTNWCEPLTC